MRTETFRTILVPAAIAETARQLAAHWPGGEGMFLVPVYTGSELTHYISTGYIDAAVAEMLDDPTAFAEATGIPPEQAESLRSQLIISTEPDVHADLAARGFSLEPQGDTDGS